MNGVELVATTDDIGFVTDRGGVIHAWNQAAQEAFGLAAEEASGRPCRTVLKGRDAFGNDYCGPTCPLMRMALEGRRVRLCELHFSGGDGIFKPYSLMTLLLRGVMPLDPTVVHLLHPALRDRRSPERAAPKVSGNHQRGELTPRELEVLSLLAEGGNTARIAQTLRISRATVSNHIQHILH